MPLLLSIRKSTPVNIDGISDTILNVGMNDNTCHLISKFTGNRHFALDLYMRFLMNYGSSIMGIPKQLYDDILQQKLKSYGISYARYFTVNQLEIVIADFKKLCTIPDDPYIQLVKYILFMTFNV